MIGYNNQNVLKLGAFAESDSLDDGISMPASDPMMNMEYVSSVNQGHFSTIGRLESAVSLLQTAQINIDKIRSWLMELSEFLEGGGAETYRDSIPRSVTNNFIDDRLRLIQDTVNSASFQNRKVLNGEYGVTGRAEGSNLQFVRGSARVADSPESGYPVVIYQGPKPSFLTGAACVTEEEIRKESLISLYGGSQEVRYRVHKGETTESLVENLQQLIIENNLDIGVYLTKDNRLFFKHNQLGSRNHFRGVSYQSRLISKTPGQISTSTPGIDIAGMIGGESAHGDGGFLIGDPDNKCTDGLAVFFGGVVNHPGEEVGRVYVKQNGLTLPLDASQSKMEVLSIPSIDSSLLAIGVTNLSGQENLKGIRASNTKERIDALRMVAWSSVYLEYLLKELKIKEDAYVNRTIEMLRGDMTSQPIGEDSLISSRDKTDDMVTQLRAMLET